MPVPTNPVLPVSPFQGGGATGPSSYQQLIQSSIAHAKQSTAAPTATPAATTATKAAGGDDVKAS